MNGTRDRVFRMCYDSGIRKKTGEDAALSKHQSLIETLLSVQDAENGTLPESAAQLRDFADEMPGGFFIYRADGGEELIYSNKAILRIFNCADLREFQELTGNSFRGMVHPEDLDDVEESIRTQIEHSQYDLDYVEYRIIQKGGAVIWVEDYGHFVHSDAVGDIFYVFLADATEKHQMRARERSALLNENSQKEELLHVQAEEYSEALEHINDELGRRLELIGGLSIDYEAIFHVDLDEDVIQPYRVSESPEYQFGKDLQVRRFVGFAADYIETWIFPDDREAFTRAVDPAYIRETLKNRKSFNTNYRIVKNGRTEYLQIFIVNVGKTEKVTQIMVGCRSVDEGIRREMERNQILEDALQQAKSANIVRNTFLSNMSHDMRTPLNAIVGFASLAKSHLHEPERLGNYLNLIDTSSSQLLHLMDNVLEISWFESGDSHIEEAPCSLLDIARNLQKELLPQAGKKELEFSIAFSRLEHPNVYADSRKLTEVLLRLCENAVKYTEPGGRITVTFAEQNAASPFASYQFRVEDNGIGINEDFMTHLFDPFERQKNTTMSGVPGTGLGLPIAKGLVEMMGGTIEVASRPGKGSVFTVNLGLRFQEEQAEEDTGSAARDFSQQRILVVEDNELNMEIEVDLLEDAGFLVDTAENGSIALEKVRASEPGYYALILMDIQMPVMDGHSAAHAIRSLDNPALSSIPIVALSANTFDEDRKMSTKSGMNAHMAKPINIPEILNLIEHFLRKRRTEEG